MDYDLIVIGSGFGGAPVALRAALAGLRVCVLEKGRRMSAAAFALMAAGKAPLLHVERGQRTAGGRLARRGPGVAEIRLMPGLACVSGCAVGGGSHHYTSVTIAAPDEIFDEHWPVEWTAASMRAYHARVAKRLQPAPIANPAPQTVAMEALATQLGARVMRLPLALDWQPPRYETPRVPGEKSAPQHGWRFGLATWMQGNGASNKITVDRAYLDEAEARGAVIRPQHSVTRIVPNADGYSVEFTHTLDGARHHGSLRARVVVVSAGTLGTVRLLLAARDRDRALPNISAALGARFSTNGDSGALLVGPRWPLEGGPTPVATAWLDYWESDRLFLMDLGPLPVWKKRLAQLLPTLLWLRHRGRQAASPHAWIIGTMGFDHSPGRLFLDRYGRMRHAVVRDDGGIAQRTRLRLKQLAEAAGATLLAPPTRPITRRSVTVHPLGGCALADSPQHGVCDPSGQVFGYPNLYLSDGSLLPTATGRPPSMTIAAVAERVAEGIIRRL